MSVDSTLKAKYGVLNWDGNSGGANSGMSKWDKGASVSAGSAF